MGLKVKELLAALAQANPEALVRLEVACLREGEEDLLLADVEGLVCYSDRVVVVGNGVPEEDEDLS